MYLWIINSKSGVTLFYHSLKETALEINEHLISGLIAALNHFTVSQFKQPIDSIEMGGLKWIYIHDPVNELLCVAADSRDVNAEILKARLDTIRITFIKQYLENNPTWNGKFEGDIGMFLPFKEVVEQYYTQWSHAEIINEYAEIFDILGVIQNIFNLIKRVLDEHIPYERREDIYDRVEDKFLIFRNKSFVKRDPELQKITFSREEGFKVVDINPMMCDISAVRKYLMDLFKSVVTRIKEEVGYETSLKLFAMENILIYVFKNLNLLKNLNIDEYVLELFLIE